MTKKIKVFSLGCLIISFCYGSAQAQILKPAVQLSPTNFPWTNSQLIEPSELAGDLNGNSTGEWLILNIGAVEDIKGAVHVGAVSSAAELQKLTKIVATLPKDQKIVIYCGCCPFSKCPNIKPAFMELKKSGFMNVKLLDLPINLHTNWIAKGYPLAAK